MPRIHESSSVRLATKPMGASGRIPESRQVRGNVETHAQARRDEMADDMLACVPNLRAFAISLCGNADRADDLVQETLVRALTNIEQFQTGTIMGAWLFTILRNRFYTEFRMRRREVADHDNRYAETLVSRPRQSGGLETEELLAGLQRLPDEQREALVLVAASGLSYEQAAQVVGCAVGTVKSRVNRARTKLAEILSIDGFDEIGPDPTERAVMMLQRVKGKQKP
jgi:RNA polymerase sigma-70 factor (ECF subfamily)